MYETDQHDLYSGVEIRRKSDHASSCKSRFRHTALIRFAEAGSDQTSRMYSVIDEPSEQHPAPSSAFEYAATSGGSGSPVRPS